MTDLQGDKIVSPPPPFASKNLSNSNKEQSRGLPLYSQKKALLQVYTGPR